MDQAQGAQGIYEMQFARVEFAEVFITCKHTGQLPYALFALAGEQHPQVMHRRPHAAVVEIDEVRAVVRLQYVACMAIAVQAQITAHARRIDASQALHHGSHHAHL